jgi:hypothetical protein
MRRENCEECSLGWDAILKDLFGFVRSFVMNGFGGPTTSKALTRSVATKRTVLSSIS